MDKEWKTRWIEALRSGKYKQGSGMLYDEHSNTFCCLGVLRELAEPNAVYGTYAAGTESAENTCDLRETHAKGLAPGQARRLANMNDEGATFEEIARDIELYVAAEDSNSTPDLV